MVSHVMFPIQVVCTWRRGNWSHMPPIMNIRISSLFSDDKDIDTIQKMYQIIPVCNKLW